MKNLPKRLFVDLEETLIDSWNSGNLWKRERVFAQLNEHFGKDRGILDATVWSFAVSNDEDVKVFNSRFKNWLEEIFGLNFIDVVSKQRIMRDVLKFRGFPSNAFDEWEFTQIWGKDKSLENWARANNFENCEIVLLDDMVQNKTIDFRDWNLRITFVRM